MLPTGESVEAFFERMKPGTWLPEGEPFNFVINPVTAASRRGWLDFKYGGYAIYEEVFPSSNFFEWATMHWGADALYEACSVPGDPSILAARKLAWGGWAYQRMVDEWLRKRSISFPRSVEEACEIVRALPSPFGEEIQPKGDCEEAILRTYAVLVARRLSHVR